MWRVKVDYSASNIDFVFDTLLKTTSSFHLETQMKLAGRLYTFFKVPIARETITDALIVISQSPTLITVMIVMSSPDE